MTFAGFGTIAGPPPQYESTINYTYDTASRLTQVVDSVSGTIQLGYDNLDRLTSEITPPGTVSYTYDAAGRRATMTAGNQAQTTYTYDNGDRLAQITQGTQSVSFTYDTADRRATLTLPNGIVLTYGYDNASQLTGMTYTLGANTLGNLTYAYDLTGRRVSMGGSWARTNMPAALASATYDAANQLTQWGTATLTYDANGNLTNDGTNTLTWNARNQLASMSGGVAATFQYDAFGRRVNKTIGGVSTGFLHDDVNPVQEQFIGGVNANLLTGGIDEFFSRTDQLGTQTLLTDALGSTWSLADPSGSILTQYTYEPFGNSTVTGSTFSPFQFTGRENDATGLLYYRARYYDADRQRFVSQDPLGFGSGDSNLYTYVYQNPPNLTDPTGEVPIAIPLALCVGGAALGAYYYWNMAGRKPWSGNGGWYMAAGCAAGLGVGVLSGGISLGVGASGTAAAAGAAGIAAVGPRLGAAAESAVSTSLKLAPNTRHIPSVLNPGTYRVPDFFSRAGNFIAEVKDVAYQPLTRQIADYAAIAEQVGMNFYLYVRSGTQLSGPLQSMVDSGRILIRTIPWP